MQAKICETGKNINIKHCGIYVRFFVTCRVCSGFSVFPGCMVENYSGFPPTHDSWPECIFRSKIA